MTGKADEHLKELITIRKLLVVALLRSGMTQAQIGAALGVHRTQIARMFPSGALQDTSKKRGKLKSDTVEVGDEPS